MATVLRRDFQGVSRSSTYKITPLGDIHLGAAACDEKSFKSIVKTIQEEEDHYWIGMGDYGDFINMKDPRFSLSNLAEWIQRKELADLAKAQRNRFLDLTEPIAHKCLALLVGNHETAIMKHYERDIYSEIISGIKERGGFPSDHKLGLGYYGWIKLNFYRDKKKQSSSAKVIINAHHGFVGGKLAGAKALNMQRWLWSHEADLVIFGHSHNVAVQPEAVEWVDKGDNVRIKVKKGMYSGTFLKTVNDNKEGYSTYSEVKGYFPNPHGVVPSIILKPRTSVDQERIKIIA